MIAGVGSVLVALCLSAFGLLVLFERHVERRVAAELEIHLDQLIAGLERDAGGELVLARPPADPRFDQPLSGLHWQIVVRSNDTIVRSRSLWDHVLSLPAQPMIDGAVHKHRLRGLQDRRCSRSSAILRCLPGLAAAISAPSWRSIPATSAPRPRRLRAISCPSSP
jgi:hypothetical protein